MKAKNLRFLRQKEALHSAIHHAFPPVKKRRKAKEPRYMWQDLPPQLQRAIEIRDMLRDVRRNGKVTHRFLLTLLEQANQITRIDTRDKDEAISNLQAYIEQGLKSLA